eukprot:403366061
MLQSVYNQGKNFNYNVNITPVFAFKRKFISKKRAQTQNQISNKVGSNPNDNISKLKIISGNENLQQTGGYGADIFDSDYNLETSRGYPPTLISEKHLSSRMHQNGSRAIDSDSQAAKKIINHIPQTTRNKNSSNTAGREYLQFADEFESRSQRILNKSDNQIKIQQLSRISDTKSASDVKILRPIYQGEYRLKNIKKQKQKSAFNFFNIGCNQQQKDKDLSIFFLQPMDNQASALIRIELTKETPLQIQNPRCKLSLFCRSQQPKVYKISLDQKKINQTIGYVQQNNDLYYILSIHKKLLYEIEIGCKYQKKSRTNKLDTKSGSSLHSLQLDSQKTESTAKDQSSISIIKAITKNSTKRQCHTDDIQQTSNKLSPVLQFAHTQYIQQKMKILAMNKGNDIQVDKIVMKNNIAFRMAYDQQNFHDMVVCKNQNEHLVKFPAFTSWQDKALILSCAVQIAMKIQ